jgi:large subunit ribosomal protein L32
MAVQQNKKSPSKRGMHRAHDFFFFFALAVEPISGEVHMRHHISPNGYYRGKKVIKTKGESSNRLLSRPPVVRQPVASNVLPACRRADLTWLCLVAKGERGHANPIRR